LALKANSESIYTWWWMCERDLVRGTRCSVENTFADITTHNSGESRDGSRNQQSCSTSQQAKDTAKEVKKLESDDDSFIVPR
jgi:hypothetical protein